MPARRRTVRRKKGYGFLGDLWNDAKKKLAAVHKNIKETKSISRALGWNKRNPEKSSTLGNLAHSLGYGPRRRRVRRRMPMYGSGFFGDLWDGFKSVAAPLNNLAKSTGIIGRVLPGPAGGVARALGYGRRRRKPGPKRRRGGMVSVMPRHYTMYGGRLLRNPQY